MKKLIVGGLAALAIGLAVAAPVSADVHGNGGVYGSITPDEWYMDDGVGVGTRTPGTRCLASESHQWADNPDDSGYALWCPPPAFVWIPVVGS